MKIRVEQLGLIINNTPILKGISFTVPHGSFVSLVGPNGAGKSSILRVIAKDVAGYSGTVTDLRQGEFTYLPQGLMPPPFLSTIDVVKLGFYGQGLTDHEKFTESNRLLETCGIQDIWSHPFVDISAGEKQRAWLAFALAQAKELILMDEPLAAIDIPARRSFFELLRSVVDEGKTLVLVAHDIGLVREFCDRLIFLQHGQKSFEGSPADFELPLHWRGLFV